jgi:phosphotransacetylase
MELLYDPQNGPVMRAAKTALETGDANYIVIWVPEESENTLKNLLEKTCCTQSIKNNMQNRAIDWYFDTVNRLCFANRKMMSTVLKPEGSGENLIVSKAVKAIETGSVEEITDSISVAHEDKVKQRFRQVMNMKNFPVNNPADGRAYVAAFFEFIGYVQSLSFEIPGKRDH